jgi:hypothetical protein
VSRKLHLLQRQLDSLRVSQDSSSNSLLSQSQPRCRKSPLTKSW